jgi:predicted ATPase/class 3 adenylate cyclase
VSLSPDPVVPSRPSGTVTFAFTDIEGSTQRWERDRAAMESAVRRHDELMRAAIAAQGGHVFKTIGDGYCAAFGRPEAAVAAMLAAQRALAAEDFSALDGLRIRAAIHTGTADERDGDYFGSTVNRVARLLAIGHGGQVLISGVTADLTQGGLPPRTSLRDLGEHRLKDLIQREQVYQLVAEGLPETFPPLRSLESLPNNLPLQLTSFVGREEEVAEIAALIGTTRLLTLVGTGGVGKTRTALQVAADLLDGSGDGVWFVDLAPLSDPSLVAHEVVSALGLTVPPEKTATEVVVAYLKPRRLLLILDNCEHLVAAAANLIDSILRACPQVKILATSREGLNVSGEWVHRMPSLGVPPEGAPLNAAQASAYGAVALFAERARAADGRFTLTDQNAPIVGEICRRLDGIALAIELAAPRVKVLAVEQLSRRLDERFRILTGGNRNALPRQQTMRALIDWSYDLLSENEKTVFRRAGAFVGGFTLEAAASVCAVTGLDEWEVLEILSTLVDKSLVATEILGSQQRYRLLESMREYARARLIDLAEFETTSNLHAAYYVDYAKRKCDEWEVTPGSQWIAPMLPEIDNFRAALVWSLEHEPIVGGQLAASLCRFFDRLAMQEEGLRWIEAALAAPTAFPKPLEGDLHDTRFTLLVNQGRFEAAVVAARRALEIARELGDERRLVAALLGTALAMSTIENDEELSALAGEAATLARSLGDELLIARATIMLAASELFEVPRRREMFASAIATQKRLRRQRMAALSMLHWSFFELAHGDATTAREVASQAAEICSGIEPTMHLRSLGILWRALLQAGDTEQARATGMAQLELGAALQKPLDCRHGATVVVALQESVADAVLHAKLLGYAGSERTTMSTWATKSEATLREGAIARVKTVLGADAYEAYAAEGATWDESTACAAALKLQHASSARRIGEVC